MVGAVRIDAERMAGGAVSAGASQNHIVNRRADYQSKRASRAEHGQGQYVSRGCRRHVRRLIDGHGPLAYAQTRAFTTLVLFQLFNVLNARSDDVSAFVGLFSNIWIWVAIALAVLLQVIVVYVPLLQRAFGTVPLSAMDWVACTAVASTVLWLRELSKLVGRA